MKANMELYRIFHTVASFENISQAADNLYISQPAVSRAMKKLEATIGITLFSRNSKGVNLTSEGKIFFDYIDRAISEISSGEKIINKLTQKEQGIIKLGVSNTLCKYLLIPFLKEFIEKYPHIKIQIINKTTHDTLEQLNNAKIDFGIVSLPFEYSKYNFFKLLDVHDTFVVAKENYVPSKITGTKEILSQYPLMLLESDNITRKYIDGYFIDNDISIFPDIEIGSMDFLIEFAKIGLGAACVIKEFVLIELQQGILKELPIYPIPEKRSIGIVSHKKIPLSIASQTFINYLKTVVNKLVPDSQCL